MRIGTDTVLITGGVSGRGLAEDHAFRLTEALCLVWGEVG
jgi:short-subunit dehydrogenase involved in D-alanine esterification of teichoic acids